MNTNLSNPEGLKDSECKKGMLSNWPPILNVPPEDLLGSKEGALNMGLLLSVSISHLEYMCDFTTETNIPIFY